MRHRVISDHTVMAPDCIFFTWECPLRTGVKLTLLATPFRKWFVTLNTFINIYCVNVGVWCKKRCCDDGVNKSVILTLIFCNMILNLLRPTDVNICSHCGEPCFRKWFVSFPASGHFLKCDMCWFMFTVCGATITQWILSKILAIDIPHLAH